MITNEHQLKHSYRTLAKMLETRDHCVAEPEWDSDMRNVVVAGIDNQIKEIELEIAEFLQKSPIPAKQEQVA